MMTITCLIGVVVAASLTSADAGRIEAPARARPAASADKFRNNAEVLKSSDLTASSLFGSLAAADESLETMAFGASPSWPGAYRHDFFYGSYMMNDSVTRQDST